MLKKEKKKKKKRQKIEQSQDDHKAQKSYAAITNLEDRISKLPDHIISIILSFLPIKQSARTSILSPQWRYLWILSPVFISDSALLEGLSLPEDFQEIYLIDSYIQILTLHPGPIHTCLFTQPFWNKHCQTLTRLLKLVTSKGVRHLKITAPGDAAIWYGGAYCLPSCVTECQSLEILELNGTHFPNTLPYMALSKLRRLHLCMNDISSYHLEYLLEDSFTELILEDCHYMEKLDVDSPVVEILDVKDSGDHYMKWLDVRDTPKLKMLLFSDTFTRNCEVKILNAPKLEVLKCVDMKMLMFQVGDSRFDSTTEPNEVSPFNTRMHSVRTLGIKVNLNYINQGKTVPYFLRCFPCVEDLDVLIDDMDYNTDDDDYDPSISPSYGNFWEQEFDIDCMKHLKFVTLRGYSKCKNHDDFLVFLARRAHAIKDIEVIFDETGKKKKKKKNIHLEPRSPRY